MSHMGHTPKPNKSGKTFASLPLTPAPTHHFHLAPSTVRPSVPCPGGRGAQVLDPGHAKLRLRSRGVVEHVVRHLRTVPPEDRQTCGDVCW